ncbi:hypothetical protein EDB81DRAFT_799476 [Dactylonectria macrodidyma]|uniref:FAD-binding domain-containing protein n=1 Tax=Dactylonectria macrodidyma TaxID=307937 RepID=A0A9P9EPE5_9HYPO|nr:hypothetical protein EDB81DRAFT_799476 [Dactylonectria macrodidyma]
MQFFFFFFVSSLAGNLSQVQFAYIEPHDLDATHPLGRNVSEVYKGTTIASRMALKILIVGAGVSGPALAMLLRNSNPLHNVTVVERSLSLRAQGQQIDLKNQAPYILRKMDLLDTIKSRCVNETGTEVVGPAGDQIAYFGAGASGERRPGMTSEHEIMRGDMVQIIYDASIRQEAKLKGKLGKNGLNYVFGQTITALDQRSDGVHVTFSDDRTERYDLVVGADGQRSRTRRLAFGSEVSNAAFKSIGVHAAYFDMPRVEGEGTLAKAHLSPGRNIIVTRPSGRDITGVLLFTKKESPKIKQSYKEQPDRQKEAFAEEFRDLDWQNERVLAGLQGATEFYASELGQIKMKQLHTGRVVLVGDAGYCASPFTGLGTNLSVMGAYILAGELTRQGNNITGALQTYEAKMRPVIDECQRLPLLSIFFPSSRLGVWAVNTLIWMVSKLVPMFPTAQGEENYKRQIPEYPELNLSS